MSGCCPRLCGRPRRVWPFFWASFPSLSSLPYLESIEQVIDIPPGRDQNGIRQRAVDVGRPVQQLKDMHQTNARRVSFQDVAQELGDVVTQDVGEDVLLLVVVDEVHVLLLLLMMLMRMVLVLVLLLRVWVLW